MENLIKDFIKNPTAEKLYKLRSMGCKFMHLKQSVWQRLTTYKSGYLLSGRKVTLYEQNREGKMIAFAIGYY